MNKIIYNIDERIPIWMALSNLYLDTELSKKDFNYIASQIIESPYSLEEVKRINKYEVFPILQVNLLNVAGVWDGFDEAWLIEKINKRIENKSFLKKFKTELYYKLFGHMNKEYWSKLEKEYNLIKAKK